MRSRTYPFEAAVLDRQGKRVRREAELAAAVRTLARAETAAGEALAALNTQLSTRPRLGEAGPAPGRELRRSAAFARRHAREVEILRTAYEAAHARVAVARDAVGAARTALAEAHAAQQVLERDREQHLTVGRKQAHEAEQQELDEQRGARRRPR